MVEPRAVPMLTDISSAWWYCLECGEKNPLEVHIRHHWMLEHLEQGSTDLPMNGVDYAVGSQLVILQNRRAAWIEERAIAFFDEMHELFGAEDFLAEAEIRDV